MTQIGRSYKSLLRRHYLFTESVGCYSFLTEILLQMELQTGKWELLDKSTHVNQMLTKNGRIAQTIDLNRKAIRAGKNV